MIEYLKAIAGHGVLGAICVILILAYNRERKERNQIAKQQVTDVREYQKAVQELQSDYLEKSEEREARHRQELGTVMERHANKAETWMEKHRELAIAQQNLLDAALTTRR